MGSGETLSGDDAAAAADHWDFARRACLEAARSLVDLDLAKEELNRLLEPWALCRTVLTGTDWANFWTLRTHEAAHPAFRLLARAMYVAYSRSVPEPIAYGKWHLPFMTEADREAAERYARDRLPFGAPVGPAFTGPPHELVTWPDFHLCRWSAARSARVSYGLLDGRPATPEADDETWAKLLSMDDPRRAAHVRPETFRVPTQHVSRLGAAVLDPLHASPLEHQGTPMHPAWEAARPRLRSNLTGYVQFRKLFGGENVRRFVPDPEAVSAWAAEIPPEVFSAQDIY